MECVPRMGGIVAINYGNSYLSVSVYTIIVQIILFGHFEITSFIQRHFENRVLLYPLPWLVFSVAPFITGMNRLIF